MSIERFMRAPRPLIGCRLVVLLCTVALSACPNQQNDAPPDVFVLLVDTLRADALSTYNSDLPIGEGAAGLARDGLVFERLRASSSWTRSSIASLITGKTVAAHGVFSRRDRLSDRHATLASLLAARGYRTHAWSTNPNIHGIWGFARGFDDFTDLPPINLKPGATEAEDVVAHVIDDLAHEPEGPLFYYIHMMDPHEPYVPRDVDIAAVEGIAGAVKRNFPGSLATPRRRQISEKEFPAYLAEVRDADRAVGRFLAHLREIGRYDNALILLLSDHGEEFADHGGVGHGKTLYDEVLRVPGILKLPGNRYAGQRFAGNVEMIDLLPTLASILDLPLPGEVQGRDVLPQLKAPDAFEDVPGFYSLTLDGNRVSAVRLGNWKLIYSHHFQTSQLFDLANDPTEQLDVALQQPERVNELAALIEFGQKVHRPGWHVRGCGCAQPSTLAFELSSETGTPVPEAFEPEDELKPTAEGGKVRVRMRLMPTRMKHANEKARTTTREDFDELWLEKDSKVVLGAGVAPPLRVALGNGPIESLDASLDLASVSERATVGRSERVVCDPTGKVFWRWIIKNNPACEPHLRVWWVRPTDTLTLEEVDPAIRERLRALGYAW